MLEYDPHRAASCAHNSDCPWERCWWIEWPRECIDYKRKIPAKTKKSQSVDLVEILSHKLLRKETEFAVRMERLRSRNRELLERFGETT